MALAPTGAERGRRSAVGRPSRSVRRVGEWGWQARGGQKLGGAGQRRNSKQPCEPKSEKHRAIAKRPAHPLHLYGPGFGKRDSCHAFAQAATFCIDRNDAFCASSALLGGHLHPPDRPVRCPGPVVVTSWQVWLECAVASGRKLLVGDCSGRAWSFAGDSPCAFGSAAGAFARAFAVVVADGRFRNGGIADRRGRRPGYRTNTLGAHRSGAISVPGAEWGLSGISWASPAPPTPR